MDMGAVGPKCKIAHHPGGILMWPLQQKNLQLRYMLTKLFYRASY
jgi:hypothetical protein